MINKAEEQGLITPGKTVLVSDTAQTKSGAAYVSLKPCDDGRSSQQAATPEWVLHT